MKKLLCLLSIFITSITFGQSLSEYQYVSLPNTFSFQKKEHQYNLNKLTQFLLNKYNFKAFIEGENHEKLSTINACEILRLKVDMKGALSSKAILHFIDCKGDIVYTSKEGVSKRKEYKESYTEAIRNAFKDEKIKNHIYSKKEKTPIVNKVKEAAVVEVEKHLPITTKTKIETFQLVFELRGKQYSFVPASPTTYTIFQNTEVIGKAIQLENSNKYKIEAGTLSGKGSFDDFGNFTLKRINPANQKELIDTMNRVQ